MTPSGWEVKKLNELCEINPKKPSKPSDELVSFISMSQVSEDGQIISTETKTYDEVSKGFTSFKDKDVLVAKITPCFENGKGALAHTLVNGIGFGSTEFHVLRAKENTDPKFIYYLTRTDAFRAKGTMNMQGSAGHRRVTTDFIQIYKINTPPLPEQQKIAKILSTWDKAISTTERLIDSSTQQKKALMQQLLTGKKRLLDESGNRFEGEWEEIELGDVCSRVMEKNNGQSTNVVTISAQQGLIRQEEFFKKSVASKILDNYFVISKGQFAYNKSYSNGYPMGAIKRLNRYEDGVVTTLYICFEIKDHSKTDTDFLEQYFDSGLLNRGLTQVAAEGGRAHGLLNVKPSDFMALKFKLPTYSEQQKIATVLTNADKEIELLEQQLADLQQEKKALMQVLLTGKKRVTLEELE